MSAANIAHTLRYLGTARSFAARRFVSAKNLLLNIQRFGAVALPIEAATAKRLIKEAQPSPFGLREKTLCDPKVRNSWEIPGKRVRLDWHWQHLLQTELGAMREELQLPQASALKVELDKLLIYERGQFFLPHQDSEKCDGMIGTLVVVMPSDYAGGDVAVEHQGKRVEFRRVKRADKDLTLLAFYADCRHEIRPITRGYRVALTFRLVVEGAAPTVLADTSTSGLTQQVRAHFEAPPPKRFEGDERSPPDRLVYLLDHEYTQKGLRWSHLKGVDSERAAALKQAGEALDCHVCLALADVHETWGCADEDDRWHRRRRRYRMGDDDDDDDENDGEDLTLTDLQVSEIDLLHGIDTNGKPMPGLVGMVDDKEVCCTKESVETTPFETNYEPYQGNYGNTVDRWYHRAAVVLWPRARDFAIRAQASPEWGLETVRAVLKAEGVTEARRLASQLAPLLPRGGDRSGLFSKTLKLAVAIDDRDVAGELLSRFGFDLLGRESGKGLRGVHDAYGLPFCTELLEGWEPKEKAWRGQDAIGDLGGLAQALCKKPQSVGLKKLARYFVEREWTILKPTVEKPVSPAHRKYRFSQNSAVIDLLHACELAGCAQVQKAVLRALTSPKADYSTDEIQRLTGDIAKSPYAKSLTTVRKELLEHAVGQLKKALARPQRNPEDWSIRTKLSCTCDLCQELTGFLKSQQTRLLWPLAKNGRSHVHGAIENHCLPVEHVTHRQGSPHTLVLTKSPGLFKQEAAQRKAWEKELKKLERA